MTVDNVNSNLSTVIHTPTLTGYHGLDQNRLEQQPYYQYYRNQIPRDDYPLEGLVTPQPTSFQRSTAQQVSSSQVITPVSASPKSGYKRKTRKSSHARGNQPRQQYQSSQTPSKNNNPAPAGASTRDHDPPAEHQQPPTKAGQKPPKKASQKSPTKTSQQTTPSDPARELTETVEFVDVSDPNSRVVRMLPERHQKSAGTGRLARAKYRAFIGGVFKALKVHGDVPIMELQRILRPQQELDSHTLANLAELALELLPSAPNAPLVLTAKSKRTPLPNSPRIPHQRPARTSEPQPVRRGSGHRNVFGGYISAETLENPLVFRLLECGTGSLEPVNNPGESLPRAHKRTRESGEGSSSGEVKDESKRRKLAEDGLLALASATASASSSFSAASVQTPDSDDSPSPFTLEDTPELRDNIPAHDASTASSELCFTSAHAPSTSVAASTSSSSANSAPNAPTSAVTETIDDLSRSPERPDSDVEWFDAVKRSNGLARKRRPRWEDDSESTDSAKEDLYFTWDHPIPGLFAIKEKIDMPVECIDTSDDFSWVLPLVEGEPVDVEANVNQPLPVWGERVTSLTLEQLYELPGLDDGGLRTCAPRDKAPIKNCKPWIWRRDHDMEVSQRELQLPSVVDSGILGDEGNRTLLKRPLLSWIDGTALNETQYMFTADQKRRFVKGIKRANLYVNITPERYFNITMDLSFSTKFGSFPGMTARFELTPDQRHLVDKFDFDLIKHNQWPGGSHYARWSKRINRQNSIWGKDGPLAASIAIDGNTAQTLTRQQAGHRRRYPGENWAWRPGTITGHNGFYPGQFFISRGEVSTRGLHAPAINGVHTYPLIGAFSIWVGGDNIADKDLGEVLIYSLTGATNRNAWPFDPEQDSPWSNARYLDGQPPMKEAVRKPRWILTAEAVETAEKAKGKGKDKGKGKAKSRARTSGDETPAYPMYSWSVQKPITHVGWAKYEGWDEDDDRETVDYMREHTNRCIDPRSVFANFADKNTLIQCTQLRIRRESERAEGQLRQAKEALAQAAGQGLLGPSLRPFKEEVWKWEEELVALKKNAKSCRPTNCMRLRSDSQMLSMLMSHIRGAPIRVIRAGDGVYNATFRPFCGYRYDGLYKERYESHKGYGKHQAKQIAAKELITWYNPFRRTDSTQGHVASVSMELPAWLTTREEDEGNNADDEIE
ncbi:hypothetical protein BROUX41_001642 [Berkeleyomyces rouxiae]